MLRIEYHVQHMQDTIPRRISYSSHQV